jgi:hypothetical protein
MDTSKILTELRTERDRLTQAIAAIEALGGTAVSRQLAPKIPSKTAAPSTKHHAKKRVIGAEARERMAEAQRKRWAGHKKAAKTPAAKKSAKDASKV